MKDQAASFATWASLKRWGQILIASVPNVIALYTVRNWSLSHQERKSGARVGCEGRSSLSGLPEVRRERGQITTVLEVR